MLRLEHARGFLVGGKGLKANPAPLNEKAGHFAGIDENGCHALVIAARRVVNGLIEWVMFPEFLAQQFSGEYLGVVARLERDRPSSALMISYMELVSTNGICALDDDATATLVRWTDLRLNWLPVEGRGRGRRRGRLIRTGRRVGFRSRGHEAGIVASALIGLGTSRNPGTYRLRFEVDLAV
jgi:hypothetical protein